MSILKTADDSSFKREVLESETPVLVDFSAAWCGPCKRQTPILEELASEYKDSVRFVKIDIDEAMATASHFKVKSVPTLMLFKSGQLIKSQVGLASKDSLKKLIDG